jgi:hypothetical protein
MKQTPFNSLPSPIIEINAKAVWEKYSYNLPPSPTTTTKTEGRCNVDIHMAVHVPLEMGWFLMVGVQWEGASRKSFVA